MHSEGMARAPSGRPSKSPSRVALVTGATRGIGEAVARGLAAHGLTVIVTGRDAERGHAVAKNLGRLGTFLPLDVTSADDIDEAAEVIRVDHGGLDVLVNNSGVSLDGFDEQIARRTLDVNFLGAVRLTDRMLPQMRANSRIVMVSSGLGELSGVAPALRAAFVAPTLDRAALFALADRFVADVASGTYRRSGWPSSAYGVSKIAMNAYVRILARELAAEPRRILVNAACPGWVRTAMGGSSAPRSAEAGAKTPLWLSLLPPGGPTGGFFRDERAIAW
jgi:carbonyl reductase 1